MSNPKTNITDNTRKDPDDWVSGDERMTGAQASYLKTLCEQVGDLALLRTGPPRPKRPNASTSCATN
jgi:hypothetical protein